MEFLLNVIRGACIGIADAIPGVSGGTIAFILKIYDKFLDAIDLNPRKLKKNLPFLIPLVIGIGVGIVIASFGLKWLFENHNIPTQFFFIGVIIGSLPMIYRECVSEAKLKPIHALPFFISVIGIILFNNLKEGTADFANNPAAIIVTMALSAASMLLPGLSGAMVLKILGGYDRAITAVTEFDIATLLLYCIGAAIGLLVAAKVISILLLKCRRGMYCVIIGLIIGSLPAIFPEGLGLNLDTILAVITCIIGVILPNVMERMGKRQNKSEPDRRDQTEPEI